MVVGDGGQFDALGAVVQADLTEHSGFDEEMNVLVDGSERDRGDLPANFGVDLFGAGVALHAAHDFVENTALVGDGDAALFAELSE